MPNVGRAALRQAIAASLALLPAACGGGAPSDEAILAEAGKLAQPLPGKYRSVTRLTRFELPNASPQEADRLRTLMGGLVPQASEFCLSAAQARDGFAQMLRRSQQGDCRFARFGADASRLNAEMRCTGAAGSTSTVVMEGEGGARRSRMTLRVDQRAASIPGGELQMELEVSNRRTGDC